MSKYFEKNGWKLFFHPLFESFYKKLVDQVEELSQCNSEWKSHPKTKILARIQNLIEKEIPRDPSDKKYRQGKTLGSDYKHWKRAKFLKRFRLFFRYSEKQKIIIYVWVNDENSLRKAGSKHDPYALFYKKLQSGNPPDNLDDLLLDAMT